MSSNLKIFEDIIEQAKKEIEHLNEELQLLERSRADVGFSEYENEKANIEYHIEIEQGKISKTNEIINNYNKAKELVIERKNLDDSIKNATDTDTLQSLKEQAEKENNELLEIMNLLPNNLREDIEKIFLTSEPTVLEWNSREELEEALTKFDKEIKHLNDELQQLETARADIGFSEYEGEKANIEYYIEKEEEKKKPVQDILNNYNKAKRIILRLNKVESLIPEARDRQDLDEMHQEIIALTDELNESLSFLSPSLEAEIRESISQENTINNEIEIPTKETVIENNETTLVYANEELRSNQEIVQEAIRNNPSLEDLESQLEIAEQCLQDSITRMQEIFTEERRIREEEGPFSLEELEAFEKEYMDKKIREEEIFLAIKKNKEELEMLIAGLEKTTEKEQVVENPTTAIVLYKDIENQIAVGSDTPRTPVKTTEDKINTIIDNIGKYPIIVRNPEKIQPAKGEGVPADLIEAKPLLTGPVLGDTPLLPPPNEKEEDKTNTDVVGLLPPGKTDDKDNIEDTSEANNTNTDEEEQDKSKGNTILFPHNKENEEETTKQPEKPKEPEKQPESKKKTSNNRKKQTRIPVYGILKKIRGDVITNDNQDLFKSKNTNRYKRSNLVVSKQFKDELHSGNYLYNIVHVVPAIGKAAFGFLSKLSGKLLKNKKTNDMMDKLRENAAALTPEEKEVLFQEYKENTLLSYKQPAAVDMVIEETIRAYTLGKVTSLNEQISQKYSFIVNMIAANNILQEDYANKKIKKVELDKSINNNYREMANAIDVIIALQDESKNLLSGGLHGFSEDLKAKASKMNFVGRRFSTESFDVELDDRLAELEHIFKNSHLAAEREAKVNAFIEFEKLHAQHTVIENSIYGERSVGEKYYSPLAEELDYSNDPFIRDLISTTVLLSSSISTINGFRVEFQGEKILNEQQAEALSANAHNTAAIDYANQAGETIQGSRETFINGFEAQSYQTDVLIANMVERGVLDKNVWATGTDAYRMADDAGHLFYTTLHEGVKNDISTVINDCARGTIDQSTTLELLNNIAANSQSKLNSVTEACYEILQPYAVTHPQFDLSAVSDVMDYILKNPTAISNMNQAIIDIDSFGDGLVGLTAEQVTVLESLPSDLGTTLLAAASGAALALNVVNQVNGKSKSNKYGNEVTDLVNSLFDDEEEYEIDDFESSKSK